MPTQLTLEDARQSLTAHVEAKGLELRRKYGPRIGWQQLQQILADGECVRYPCKIAFDAEPLQQGEFAHPVQIGELPQDGFTIFVHPYFSVFPAQVPYLALYQLVLVNYGPFASPDDAEIFGSAALGLSRQDYYDALCEMADEISPVEPATGGVGATGVQAGCSCSGGACSQ